MGSNIEDEFSRYEAGVEKLITLSIQRGGELSRDSEDLRTLQFRLSVNVRDARKNGDTDGLRNDRAKIAGELNLLCLKITGRVMIRSYEQYWTVLRDLYTAVIHCPRMRR